MDHTPVWLLGAIVEHRPINRLNDMICSCSAGGPYITWTPEHLARKVHFYMLQEVNDGSFHTS